MRRCINDLSVERVKARAALEGMKAISNWVEKISKSHKFPIHYIKADIL